MNEQDMIAMTDEEMEKAAIRNVAFSVLPAIIRRTSETKLYTKSGPKLVVSKAYEIATELVKQSE